MSVSSAAAASGSARLPAPASCMDDSARAMEDASPAPEPPPLLVVLLLLLLPPLSATACVRERLCRGRAAPRPIRQWTETPAKQEQRGCTDTSWC